MNGAIYYAGFVAIRLSQATRSTYFANTVKTHPFCTDASKQSFFFFSIPYRFLYVSNYNVQILQIDLRSTHSTGNSFVLQISLPPPFHQTRFICFYCEIAY